MYVVLSARYEVGCDSLFIATIFLIECLSMKRRIYYSPTDHWIGSSPEYGSTTAAAFVMSNKDTAKATAKAHIKTGPRDMLLFDDLAVY